MSLIDIIVIIILALFAIIGLCKGFLNTLISLFGNVASLALSIVIAKPVAKVLDRIFNLTGFVGGKIGEGLLTTIPAFQEAITGAQAKEMLAADGTTFLEKLLMPFISDTTQFANSEALCSSLGEILGGMATIVIAVIVMFIIIRIAVLLLSKLFDSFGKNKAFSGLDRVLGMVLGLAKGALIIGVVLCIIYLLNPIPGLNQTLNGWIEGTTIVKFFYGYISEFMVWSINSIDFNSIIRNLFGTSGEISSSVAESAVAIIK